MKPFIAAVLLVLSLNSGVWATQEILYARPASICPINGDGTAYACASSNLGVGAWSGTNHILWNASDETAGRVDPGDTVYICGHNHVTTASFRVTPTVSGTAKNLITISGACPSDPGILDGDGGANGIRLVNLGSARPISYIVVDSLTLQNTPSASHDYMLSGHDNGRLGLVDRFITISNNRLVNAGWIGMWLWGSEFTITNNYLSNIGEDAIYVKGGKNTTVTSNTVDRVSQVGVGGDCIQFDSATTEPTIGTGTVIVRDNFCDKTTSPNVKYGILVGPVSGPTFIEHNRILCPIPTTLQSGCNPIYVNANDTNHTAEITVRGNYVSKGWRGITIATADNTAFRHQLVGNVMVGAGTFGAWLDGNTDNVDVVNNTFCDNQQYGLYLGKTTTTHFVHNNLFCRNATGLHYINTPGGGRTNNNFFSNTVTAIDDANGPKTLDATDTTTDPLVTPDYKLGANSQARRAGTYWSGCQDFRGHICSNPPDIGAYQSSSGDPSNTTQ